MMNLQTVPTVYSESQKKEYVTLIKQYDWTRCVTLTTTTPVTAPEMCDLLIDFSRRVGQKNGKSFKYWFGLSHDRRRLDPERPPDYTSVHVHGVLLGVENLSNEEIERCWRSRPVMYKDEYRGVTFKSSSHLGFLDVVHFDGSPNWFYYCLNQTRKGEVFTNIEELREWR